MAREAMRVLALAYCEFTSSKDNLTEEDIAGKLTFAGLVGIIDPPRPKAIESVKLCKEAGIRVVMVTGDNQLTAEAIAREICITTDEVLTGADMEKMNNEELAEKVKNVSVFARIEPLHKLKIVNAFKKLGNLRNAVMFLLATCFGELFALILCVLSTGKSPLLPIQILWINLVTGALIAIPLGIEPRMSNELKFQPRHPKVGLIYRGMVMRIICFALGLSVGSFLIFSWALQRYSLEKSRTILLKRLQLQYYFKWL